MIASLDGSGVRMPGPDNNSRLDTAPAAARELFLKLIGIPAHAAHLPRALCVIPIQRPSRQGE